MKPKRFLLLGCTLAAALARSALLGADPAPADDHLRSGLRDATLQLRSVQSQLSDVQAQLATAVGERDALTAQCEALKKKVASTQYAGEKAAASLQAQLEAAKAEGSQLGDMLFVAKSKGDDAARDIQDESSRNARLKSEVIVLTRKVSDLESKNLALFLVGNEILTRYQEFGLGTALSAKEPFVGSTRVRLENLVQDYQDKLSDQRARN
jgi:chromosome segregation ATPase